MTLKAFALRRNENGGYYDFWKETSFTEDDFAKIDEEMKRIIKADEAFERIEVRRDEAIKMLKDMGQTLKVEHLESGLSEEETFLFIDRANLWIFVADRIFRVPKQLTLSKLCRLRRLLERRFLKTTASATLWNRFL